MTEKRSEAMSKKFYENYGRECIKAKLLAYTDSIHCATGFGQVARNILIGVHNSGKYEVAQLGINYWGDPHNYPIPIWPMGLNKQNDPYGRQKFMEMVIKMPYDILFCQQDTFILMLLKDLVPRLRSINKNQSIVCYFPVDGIPKSEWIEGISYADYLVAYSDWGKKMAIEAYPPIEKKIIDVLPLGINFNHFHPLPENEVKEFRRAYFKSLADNFIYTIVARNQQRKDLTRALIAFREVQKQRPDTVLYMHMLATDLGWKLGECCKSLGLDISKDVIFPNNFNVNLGYPLEVLNKVYNASDCIISTALGEGYGLSQTEGMATKTPVIMPDNTVHPEICGYGERGILVKAGKDPDHLIIIPNDFEVLRPAVHIDDMVEKMVWLYDNVSSKEVGEMVERAYKYTREKLDWNMLIPKWLDIFDFALKSGNQGPTITADLL